MIHAVIRSLRRRLTPSTPWYRDLCEYYGVTPAQALHLGTRASGRRPDLPGSPTTHPIHGKTFEELWALRERTTSAEIYAFYREMGAWAAFRQVVFHRRRHFRYLARRIRPGSRICEYGAGVAPVCYWLIEHVRGMPFALTVVDVPSEHLSFGRWRLQRRIDELKAPVTLQVSEVLPDRLPLTGWYDLITILDVYEHLPNPLEVTSHLCEHLQPGGLLWENYIVHHDAGGADLPVAQQERPQVFAYLQRHCEPIAGPPPTSKTDHGETRCWRRRG